MTMALLASSPEIALEREHPYERFYLAWMAEWAALADRKEWDGERWNGGVLVWRHHAGGGDGLVGPPPWSPRRLWDAAEAADRWGPRLFEVAWSEFSARAIDRTRREVGTRRTRVRYYAEKTLSATRLRELAPFPVRAVILHRDPRDVWLSVQAFDRARGFHGFGRGADEGEEEWFERFLAMQADRLRTTLAQRERSDSLLVAYEDLVSRPGATAVRLGAWLGVKLDPMAPARDLERHRDHSTSPSPEASIDRWRRELDPRRGERFAAEMGPELAELGYEA